MYTEQQKKEYQAMRRTRYADQQELRQYLKGGYEMTPEQKKNMAIFSKTQHGSVMGDIARTKKVTNLKPWPNGLHIPY